MILPTKMPRSSQSRELLIVVSGLQVGGTETHIATIMPELQRLNWSVTVYSLGGTGPLGERLERQNVKVIVPPLARQSTDIAGLLAAFKLGVVAFHLLAQMLRRRHAIVHFFLPEAYLVGGILAVIARVPVRVMSRRSLNVYSKSRPAIRALEIRLHWTMSAILGNSRSVVRELIDDESVPLERVGLIYNGIDAANFYRPPARQQTRAALGLAPATVAMVTVGNLIPYKGHIDLIEALRIGTGRMPADWRLFIVGRNDGIGEQLSRQAAAAGLTGKIVFLGERRDIPELLSACEIGLLCSHQEGFSNAILESMAAGLPVIVTDVGGNREAVIDRKCGLVVPPRSPAQLANAIVELANDGPLRARFGAAGRQRVQTQFSLDQCVAKYDRLYRALQAGGGLADCPDLRITISALDVSKKR
jgi:glycosyltransferase involved in cell wall biosynthesis